MQALDFDLRMLRTFAAVARTGSQTQAARELHVTQSAVSHSMRRLEEQVSCPLFFKSGKGNRLTPEGRAFLAKVGTIFEAITEASTLFTSHQPSQQARLKLVAASSVARHLLVPVLQELHECYPKLSVSVSFADTPVAVRSVEQGDADLALGLEPGKRDQLAFEPLMNDEMRCIFSTRHPWALLSELERDHLGQAAWLLYSTASDTFRQLQARFLKAGLPLESWVEVPDFELMKQMAEAGLGVALMAEWTARAELAAGRLKALPLPKAIGSVARQWGVIRQRARPLKPVELSFVGLCRLACQVDRRQACVEAVA